MFSGAISLIAKVAVPLVASAIKSMVESEPAQTQQVQAPPKPSMEQQLAARFDVTKMSVNEMKQLADTLYNAGKLSLDEYGILTSMPLSLTQNEVGGIDINAFKGNEMSTPHDFIKNLENSIAARQQYGINQGLDASVSLLSKLKAMNAMHSMPVAAQA